MITDFSILEKVVLSMGGNIENFIPERKCYYLSLKGKRIVIQRNISITRQSLVGMQLTRCKEITHKLLVEKNLPSPPTECFYRTTYKETEAIKKLKTLNFPVIIKNAIGSNSVGIFPEITSPKKVIKILNKELQTYPSMVVQEMVSGKEYRVLVLGNKVIGALEMIHPFIVGDGKSTIEKLIYIKQNSTDRRTKIDNKLLKTIKNQNLILKSILPKNKKAYIKSNACLAEGGETRNVSDIVHPEVEKMCVKASKAVGKYLVGIDIMCDSIDNKPSESFNILEINGKPDMYIHYNPTHGKSRNVLKDVINYLVKMS